MLGDDIEQVGYFKFRAYTKTTNGDCTKEIKKDCHDKRQDDKAVEHIDAEEHFTAAESTLHESTYMAGVSTWCPQDL